MSTIKTADGATLRFMDASEMLAVSRECGPQMLKEQRSWNRSISEFERKVVTGDPGLVPQADAIMRELEDLLPVSKAWRNVDDVVGSVPNIPAYLAGHPQSMRRKERSPRDNAPLTVFLNLTSSAMVSSEALLKRGVVLLALVRLLVEHRAVELWAGTFQDDKPYGGPSAGGAWKIDTTPLDLARAAYHLTSTDVCRMFGYALNETLAGVHHLRGSMDTGTFVRHERLIREAMEGKELLYVQPLQGWDKMVSEPVQWLKRQLEKYSGVKQEDAA